MPAIKYKFELTESQRSRFREVARRGKSLARKVERALVLLKADKGLADHEISSTLLISTSTVGRVRTRFTDLAGKVYLHPFNRILVLVLLIACLR